LGERTQYTAVTSFSAQIPQAQFAPSPFAKQVPDKVMQALKRNQLVLISICIHLNNNANSLFVDQGVKGWTVPTLKQLFLMAITFKNKSKKGIFFFLGRSSSKQGKYLLFDFASFTETIEFIWIYMYTFRSVCGFIIG
jgi:hypothetical protein